MSKPAIGGGAVIFGIVALLLIILLPMSFSYLDFYEYGFARRRTTGTVDISRVYEGGRHFIGPDFEFKEFYAAAQFVYFGHIPIYTTDNLQVSISVELQYFLIKEDLPLLHEAFDIIYQSIVVGNAKDSLKNSVTKFDTDEFISNRTVIQTELLRGVRRRLSGKCCLPNCKSRKACPSCKEWQICEDGCKPRNSCKKEDKGLFTEVRYLQLSDIEIPAQVNERRLLTLIRELEEEKEKSIKEEMIIRKQTELEVNKYKNLAKEAIANASANSKLLMDQAEIDYSRTIESVHNDGLNNLYKGLQLNDDKLKSSLNYMRTLQDHEKVKYSIDFNSLIARQ